MRSVPLADLRAKLGAYLDECAAHGPIVITRNGKTAAVLLVPRDDDDLERILAGRSPRFQTLLDRSRRSIEEGKGLSEEAFWKTAQKRARERKPPSRRPAKRASES
jgi:prevent-host-death family protein